MPSVQNIVTDIGRDFAQDKNVIMDIALSHSYSMRERMLGNPTFQSMTLSVGVNTSAEVITVFYKGMSSSPSGRFVIKFT